MTRVLAKLAEEPVEDLRVDFEDGYVGRSGADEDADVVRSARALAQSQQDGTAAPFGGIRIKSFEAPTRARGLRTLTAYVATLVEAGGSLDGWVVTLPKVTSVDQVEAMVHVAETLDLRFEVQVETPQSILGAGRHRTGRAHGARGRGASDRPPLRHLRLLGVLRDRGGTAVAGAPGRRPRQAGDAGSRRGNGGPALG